MENHDKTLGLWRGDKCQGTAESLEEKPGPVPLCPSKSFGTSVGRARLKRDGTRAETRFGLSAQRTSPFKLPPPGGGGSVQSTTGSRGVHISGSIARYTMF